MESQVKTSNIKIIKAIWNLSYLKTLVLIDYILSSEYVVQKRNVSLARPSLVRVDIL